MGEPLSESIIQRLHALNAAVNGCGIEFADKYPLARHLLAKDGLLDTLLVLYDECNKDVLKNDKYVLTFIDKYRSTVYDLRKLRVNLNDFEQKKVIGKGHFGVVKVVREKQTGNVYALKILRKAETLNQQHITFYKEERDIMAKAVSPWITHLQYAFQDDYNLYLVMDFHPGGDLLSLLDRFDYKFSEDMTRFYLAEITVGIHAVHSMGYVHRDIKPENVLIDRCGHTKLADFGSSAKLTSSKLVRSEMPVGTPDYIAPEVLTSMNEKQNKNTNYGIECDYWSLGIIAFEMLYGETPFKADTVMTTYNNIMNHKMTLKFNDPEGCDVSEAAKDLIKGLLDDASSRLGYSDITSHKLFFHTEWNNLDSVKPPFIPVVTSLDDTSNFEEFGCDSALPSIDDFRTKLSFSGHQLPFVGFTYTRPNGVTYSDECPSRSLADITLNSTILDETLREPSHVENELKSKKKELHTALMKIESLSANEQAKKLMQMEKKLVWAEKRAAHCEEAMKKLQEAGLEREKIISELKKHLAVEKAERAHTEAKTLEFLKSVKQKWKKEEHEKINGYREKIKLYEQAEETRISVEGEVYKQLTTLRAELKLKKEEAINVQKQIMEKDDRILKLRKEAERYSELQNCQSELEATLFQLKSEQEAKVCLRSQVEELQKRNFNLELRNAEMSSLEAEHRRSEAEVARISSELMEYRKKVESGNMHVKKLHAEALHALRKKIEAEEQQLQLERKECTQLRLQVEELSAKYNDSVVSAVSYESSFLREQEQLQTQLKEVEAELSTLAHEKADLTSELFSVTARADKETVKIAELETLLDSLQQTLRKFEAKDSSEVEPQKLLAQIELLEKQLSASQISAAADLEKLHSTENELRKKTQELTDVKLDNRSVQRELKSSQDTVQYLRELTRELRDELRNKEEEIKKYQSQEEALQTKAGLLEAAVEDFAKRCDVATEAKQYEIGRLEEKLSRLEESFASTEDRLVELRTLQMETDKLKIEKRGLENEIKLHEQEKDHLRKQEASYKDTIKDLEAKILNSQTLISSLKEICSEQDNQLSAVEQVEHKMAVVEQEKQALRSEIDSLHTELKSCRSLTNEEKSLKLFQEKKVRDLEAKLAAVDQEQDESIMKLNQHIDRLSQEVVDLQSRISALEEELHELNLKETNWEHERMQLQSELDIIKEEAAGHVKYIFTLKESNFKLTDGLDEAITKGELYKTRIEELEASLNHLQAVAGDERIRTKSTIEQQNKLIDFLQIKSENPPKKKMTLLKLFGSPREKEDSGYLVTRKLRELEDMLERERVHSKKLSDQLSKSQNEVMALKTQAHDSQKSQSASTATPSKRPLEDISNSPSVNDCNSRQRMRHKIPHRWQTYLVMRAGQCAGCLGSVPFSRNAVKCQDCGVLAHCKCSSGIANTCGLPEEFVQHFTQSQKMLSAELDGNGRELTMQGWVKIPRSGKASWERRYASLGHKKLQFYDQEPVPNLKSLQTVNLDGVDSTVIIHNSVPLSELPNTSSSELPYILKIEISDKSNNVATPVYFMTSTFDEKQKWVSVLETMLQIGNENIANDSSKGNIELDSLIVLQAVTPLDVNSVVFLDSKTALVGAVEGLFSFERNKVGKLKFRARIEGIASVHQIILVKSVSAAVLIAGKQNMAFQVDLQVLTAVGEASQMAKPNISPHRIDPLINCHLISASEFTSKRTFLCAAASDRISILVWSNEKGMFVVCRQYSTQEPCSCFLFTPNSLIVGAEQFYKIDLKNFTIKEFLDETDTSLAYAVYGSARRASFPVAIIQISAPGKHEEYFLSFYEFGIFVDAEGRRTREFDLKFTRLPVGIMFRAPHLFILHQIAIEVYEIKPESFTKVRGQSFDSDTECAPVVQTAFKTLDNPRFVGNCMKPGSVIVAATSEKKLEILSVSATFPDDPDTSSFSWSANNASFKNKTSSKDDGSDTLSLRSEASTASAESNSESFLKRTRFPSFMRASKRSKKQSHGDQA